MDNSSFYNRQNNRVIIFFNKGDRYSFPPIEALCLEKVQSINTSSPIKMHCTLCLEYTEI